MRSRIARWIRGKLGWTSPSEDYDRFWKERLRAFEDGLRRGQDEVTALVRGEPGPWDEPPAEPPRPSSIIVELGPFEVPVFGVRTLGTWEGRAS